VSSPITIGLTGLAGAGKDTVADCLVTHAGFSKIAFADRLRLEVAGAFRLGAQAQILVDRASKEKPNPLLALSQCHDRHFASLVLKIEYDRPVATVMNRARTPRQIMQWSGTEFRRAANPNYWSTQAALRIAEMRQHGHERVVVTDCRFDNEASAIRLMGGDIWQVSRPGQVETEGDHASRNDGSGLQPEAVLVNGTDINGLRHTVLRTLQARRGGAVVGVA